MLATSYYTDLIRKLNAHCFCFLKGDASIKHGSVMEISTVKINQMRKTVTVSCVAHPSTLVLMTRQSVCSRRNSAMGKEIVPMDLMKAVSVVLHV